MTIDTPLRERLFGFDPVQARTVHFVGVCGTGMGAMARLLKIRGYEVTGSDEAVYPPMCNFLKEWGIPVREGFKASNLVPEPDLVIVGNVVGRQHEEARALLSGKIPYLSFPEAVHNFFLSQKRSIAICGTHGKTTTTGLLTWALRSADKDPCFFFGGILKGLNISSHYGKGDFFVIEGDEYDTAFFDSRPKFVHYNPEITVVSGIEFDHADLYKDFNEMKKAFSMLKDIRKKNGWIIFHGDDPVCVEIFGGCERIETFGLGQKNFWSARNLVPKPEGMTYELVCASESRAEVFLPLWGRHNVLNSLAVFAAGNRAGLSVEEVKNGLRTFPGMKRRQEVFYVNDGVIMIDDFAHHPTAVRETITAAREHNPESRILAIYEPRSNTSRSDIFQNEYERAFDNANEVVLYKPIQKNTRRLKDHAFIDINLLAKKINEVTPSLAISKKEELFDSVTEKIKGRDREKETIVLIMSNGKFERIYEKLPEML